MTGGGSCFEAAAGHAASVLCPVDSKLQGTFWQALAGSGGHVEKQAASAALDSSGQVGGRVSDVPCSGLPT